MASTMHDLRSKMKLTTLQNLHRQQWYTQNKQYAEQKETPKKTLGEHNSKNFGIPKTFITL